MGKCCGPKAFTKKIKVGNVEIPIRGLEPVMFMVFNMNLTEEKILDKLLSEITELGNIIPADKQKEFNAALLSEYKSFIEKIKLNRINKNRNFEGNIKIAKGELL